MEPLLPRVRVVVLNFDGGDMTIDCLRSLAGTDWPTDRFEVVLVDNGSLDGVVERMPSEFPGVRVIEPLRNTGFAGGCNLGIEAPGEWDYVALVNNDATVEPGWLAPLVEALQADDRVGAAAPKMLLESPFATVTLTGDGTIARITVDGTDVTRRCISSDLRVRPDDEVPLALVRRVAGRATVHVPVGDGAAEVVVEWTDGRANETHRIPARTDDPSARSVRINSLGTELTPWTEGTERWFGEADRPHLAPHDVWGFSGGGVPSQWTRGSSENVSGVSAWRSSTSSRTTAKSRALGLRTFIAKGKPLLQSSEHLPKSLGKSTSSFGSKPARAAGLAASGAVTTGPSGSFRGSIYRSSGNGIGMRSAAARPAPAGVSMSASLILAAALAALLIVRIVALWFNATDLFFDEAQYWSWGKEPAFGYYSKPPLIAWIIGLTTAVCGDSTFCVRLPAPLLHTATAAVIFLIGRRFLSEAAGLAAALAFVTLPGVSLSSGIISTDVPLLLAWALALWAVMELLDGDAWWPSLLLGIALGVGLNAKYAMAFFVASLAVYMAVTPSARRLLGDARLWVALGLGAYVVAKALELADHQVFALGHLVSGHTLKHLAAAAGIGCVALMLRERPVAP